MKADGVLARFGDIMSANMHSLLDKLEDPSKMVDQELWKLRQNLADVKEATAEVMAHETQCKRVVENYNAQITQAEETAKKALLAGNEEDARVMIDKKQQLESSKVQAQKALELASANADRMRKMHDKLVSDIAYCDSKRAGVKATNEMAKAQESVNKAMEKLGAGTASADAFDRMEARAQQRLDKATASASLMSGESDPVAAIEAKYAGASTASVEDELSKMKASLGLK